MITAMMTGIEAMTRQGTQEEHGEGEEVVEVAGVTGMTLDTLNLEPGNFKCSGPCVYLWSSALLNIDMAYPEVCSVAYH